MISIVGGARGTDPKGLERFQEESEIRGRIEIISLRCSRKHLLIVTKRNNNAISFLAFSDDALSSSNLLYGILSSF